MHFEEARSNDESGEPSLAEMTSTAINILKNNKNGYFLLVEGKFVSFRLRGKVMQCLIDDLLATISIT